MQTNDTLSRLKGRMDVLPSLMALLETRSVTLAAQAMGVTQPAMSRTLERLRTHLKDPLLVRVGAGMQLTAKAETLVAPLQHILAAAEDLYTTTSFDPMSASRTFRVIIPDVVAVHLLPRLLERLEREAPSCRVQLSPWASRASQVQPLDFIISTEIGGFPHFRKQELFIDHDVLVVNARTRVPRDPFELEFVAVVPAGLDEDPVDRWLREEGVSRRIKNVVPYYLLALQLVARTGLAAILPSKMVAALAPPLELRSRELPLAQEPDQQWLLHGPQHDADAASQWLRSQVLDLCG